MKQERQIRGDNSRLRRFVFLFLGSVSLLMGIIGIFVPIWPTTCFLLLAVGCFAKSSPRMHGWMLGNRYFGRHIREYREHGTVELRILVGSLVTLWVSMALSLSLVSPTLWVAFLILAVGVAVTVHLATLSGRPAATAPVED